MKRRFLVLDAALGVGLGRAGVALDHIDPLHHDAVRGRQDLGHLAGAALVLARAAATIATAAAQALLAQPEPAVALKQPAALVGDGAQAGDDADRAVDPVGGFCQFRARDRSGGSAGRGLDPC